MARSRPRSPIAGSCARLSIAQLTRSARGAALPASIRKPPTPSSTISGMAPTRVEITGTPALIASITAYGE